MGNVLSFSSNENIQNLITSSISSSIIKHTSNCNNTSTNIIDYSFGDISGNFIFKNSDFSQSIKIDTNCLQDTKLNTEIKQDIKKNLEQQLAGGSFNYLSVDLKKNTLNSLNEYINNLNIDSIKSCLSASIQKNVISTGNVSGSVIIENISVKQINDTVLKCIQTDTSTNKVVSEIVETTKQSSVGLTVTQMIIIGITLIVCFITISSSLALVLKLKK